MVPQALLDSLEKDERYAKAIVSLAGIRTAATPGLEAAVAAVWSGEQFNPPVFTFVDHKYGRVIWTSDQTRLYKLTLLKMEETFRELKLPPGIVGMEVTISEQRKKPHFRRLAFLKALPLVPSGGELLELAGQYWTCDELEKASRELRQIRRKLKGIGLN